MSVDPTFLDAKIRHLEMLQSVITRMADNSAHLKTWSVSISAALIAFSAAVESFSVLVYSIPLIVILAGLDAQYLRLERAFRSQYDSVRRSGEVTLTDFSISPSWSAGSSVASVLFSWSVWLFYMPILVLFWGLSKLG